MKLVSWNVNGIRAIAQKEFFKSVEQLNTDILCIQETKAQDDQVEEVLASLKLDGFHLFTNSAVKKGYSGTAILTKTEPLSVVYDINMPEHDAEGRVISLEFEKFYLVNVYVPNSGSDLKRLGYRQEWDKAFYTYLKKLEENKPVIACGDFNVAHKEIDLARPKANYNKSAGYMQEEIDGMDRYTQGGLVDIFRYLHRDQRDIYSWWSYRAGARDKNVGWRIDYFLVSQSFIEGVAKAGIHNEFMGSDHCPVSIEVNF